MDRKKKMRVLAAALMACLVLAGCGAAEPEQRMAAIRAILSLYINTAMPVP